MQSCCELGSWSGGVAPPVETPFASRWAQRTPAWREVYSVILQELTRRHTTHWAAVDWLTQFGHDPHRESYPKFWRGALVPKEVWGRYDAPGWTGNGVAVPGQVALPSSFVPGQTCTSIV